MYGINYPRSVYMLVVINWKKKKKKMTDGKSGDNW